MANGERPLRGKVAIVTGGGRGIGAAICRRLAADGADIVLADILPRERTEAVAAACRGEGVGAQAVECDVRDTAAGRALVERVVAEQGRVDILVNNAAVLEGSDIFTATEEEFDRLVGVNVRGLYFLTQAAVRAMPAGGRVVNLGSIFGERVPFVGLGFYTMTKFAVAGLTRAMARELASRGITVNCIQPGPIATEMNPEEGRRAQELTLPRSPLARLGRPEEVAALVAFVAGSDSDFVSGATLTVDGAWSA